MKKAVLIPDSFKGTLPSSRICEIIGGEIKARWPECRVVSVPVADGGEGSVDCFLAAAGGEKIEIEVTGPFFEPVKAFYGVTGGGAAAVIEMAACAGLPLVEDRKDPLATTTYGVGELIIDAARRGCKKIIVGLGGSCTNDMGAGAACAAGIRFFDGDGREFVPTGGTLKDIARIDASGLSKLLEGVEITAMCDIDNPLYGPSGAAYVFAPQKGAGPAEVRLLDEGLKSAAEVVRRDLGADAANLAGGGAAGGMGAGMAAFFGAKLQMGIETVLDTVGFEELIKDADFVFTGEGKLDSQSLMGKVVIGVARRAAALGVPVVALVGGYEEELDEARRQGVTAVFSINRLPQDLSVSRFDSEKNLALTAGNVLELIKATE